MSVTTLFVIATLLVAACGIGPPVGHASGPPVATVELVAEDLAFDRDSLEIPAGGVIAITLENRDPGILHNVAIYRDAGGDPVFRGETFTGIETRTNLAGPLTPGTFRFVCDAHPTMSGTLTVAAGG
jgi:plastocyanin